MKNTLKLCLCFLVFFWTTDLSAQQKSISKSIKTIEKHQVEETIIQPKTTVVYSNQIEHSSSKKLTKIATPNSTKVVAKKEIEKATPQMVQLKEWKEELEISKRFVDEVKDRPLEEGSTLHLQFKQAQEKISRLETKITNQYSSIQMK